MTKPEYGSLEYYREYFSDILADCGTGLEQDRQTLDMILQAFDEAIVSWLSYHEDAAKVYREAHDLFRNTTPTFD